MKIKSVSGISCCVQDLDRTAEFYERLGFEIRKREAAHITAYSNWFWIDFLAMGPGNEERAECSEAANLSDRGAGQSVYLSVENVDEFYKSLLSTGLTPSTEPRDQPWGNREFILRDPDGYRLVIFKRK